MKRLIAIIFSIPLLAYCGGGNVDISKAKRLQAEPVDTPAPGSDNPKVDGLFGKGPGFSAKLSSLGVVDPVGTALNDDFDGDGITNDKETTSNFWVADYPMIDTEIAPPVTMEIRVDKVGTGETDVISSDINSDDFESRKNEGSEKYHQNEVGLRTERYERETSNSSEDSFNVQAEAGGGFLGISGKASAAYGQTKKRASSFRTTVFEDRPNRNNIDRTSRSVKSDSASNKARKYRKEKRQKQSENYTISANAGYVRAALFIKNFSVNMPVNLSNVLASLVFETAQGQIIPVQSFRLRNDDFSMFEIDVYGGSEFGPYVVELNGLNTVEIENAIANGYTPKIFIVDYDLRHVEDSNYKTALAGSFTGNNLKIIEENAKGRTALMKIIGPNRRDMYRVTAFDVDMLDDDPAKVCDLSNVDSAGSATAGVSMETVLNRLACSGDTIKYQNYVFDFRDFEVHEAIQDNDAFTEFEKRDLIFIRGISEIDGIKMQVPCDEVIDEGTLFDAEGTHANTPICYIKAASLSEEDYRRQGIWTVFANAKYFNDSRDQKINISTDATFDLAGCNGETCGIKVAEGINSTVWAGDNYDIVYISTKDLEEKVVEFGTNPLETGAALSFNTKWDKSTVGEFAFHPDVNSTYLGQAGLGDEIEIKFYLDQTKYLKANFGTPTDDGGFVSYNNFSYAVDEDSRIEKSRLFDVNQSIDFELNLGLGGTPGHWVNLLREEADDTFDLESCGDSWDYLKQEYTLCVRLPSAISGVADDGLLNLHLRPALNNAYRNSIWPLSTAYVKNFDGRLAVIAAKGSTEIEIEDPTGSLGTGTTEQGEDIKIGLEVARDIASVAYQPKVYLIELSTPLTSNHAIDSGVAIAGTTVTGNLRTAISNATENVVTVIEVDDVAEPGQPLQLGTIEAGRPISIGSESGLTIKSVILRRNVYNISLDSPLDNTHKVDTRVSVELATSPTQSVALAYHKRNSDGATFMSEWADDISSSTVPGGLEDYGLLLLGSESSTDCYLSGIYVASKCLGYEPSPMVTNWLGAGKFDNDWADASKFENFLSGFELPFSFLNSSTNFHFFMDFWPLTVQPFPEEANADIEEFVVNNTLTPGCNANPQVAVADNNKALVVWQTDNCTSSHEIRGAIVDLSAPLGAEIPDDDFLISTTNSGGVQSSPQVSIHGTTAVVVWNRVDSGTKYVYGQTVDMTASSGNETDGSDFLVANAGTFNASYHLILKANTDGRFLVVYLAQNDGQVRGDIIQPANAPNEADGIDFQISSTTSGVQLVLPDMVIGNQNKAMAVWAINTGSPSFDIYGQIIDLDGGGTMTDGSDFRASDISTGFQSNPVITVYGNTALIAFRTQHAASSTEIFGHFIEIANPSGSVVTGNSFRISNVRAGDMDDVHIASYQNRAIVVWHDNPLGAKQAYGQLIDFNASPGNETDGTDFVVNPASGNVNYIGGVTASSNRAVVTFSVASGSENKVRAQLVNLDGNWPNEPIISDDFSIGTIYEGANNHQADVPSVGIFNDRAISVHMRAPGVGQPGNVYASYVQVHDPVNILGNTQVLDLDSSHFLKAPLIERDFTVTSKLRY